MHAQALPLTFALLVNRLDTFDCARNPLDFLPGKWASNDIEGSSALGERLASKHSDLPFLLQMKQQIDDDRNRRTAIEMARERDRLADERLAMEKEDLRMAEHAREGRHAHLVRWGKRSLLSLEEATHAMHGKGAVDSAASQSPIDHPALGSRPKQVSGIVAWFRRHAPEATNDEWALLALLEPGSAAAHESRESRSAASSRARRRIDLEQSDKEATKESYSGPNPLDASNLKGQKALPDIRLFQTVGTLQAGTFASTPGGQARFAPTSPPGGRSLDWSALSILSPLGRAHARAAAAIRTDGFTVTER